MDTLQLTTQAAARIEDLLKAKKWSRAELGRRAGIDPPHITRLMKAEKPTSLDTLTKVAAALGVAVASLLGDDGAMSLPLVGVVAAGDGEDDVYDAGTVLPVHTLYPAGTVAYRVRGDSMVDALIADGDYILVRLQPSAQPGEVVVVWVPDAGTVVKLKRKKHYASANDAKPRNPIPAEGCREYGVLVGVIRKC